MRAMTPEAQQYLHDLCEDLKEQSFVNYQLGFSCWIEDFKEFVERPELEGGMDKPFPVQSEQDFRFFLREFQRSQMGYRYKEKDVFLEDYRILF